MEVHPMEGRLELIELGPPGWVPLNYDSWSTATSGTGANTVTLHTPSQNSVTYTDGSGVCHSNGTTGGNGCLLSTYSGACRNNRVFCAPVQLTNNFADPLPDVILQVANNASDTRNAITGCGDNGDKSQCFQNGVCNGSTNSAGNAAKVDCATSALSSPVGTGSTGCSYCYGNAGAITSGTNDGIRDAVLPGVATGNLSIDTLALTLTNDNQFLVTLSANYDKPFMDQAVTLDEDGVSVTCATAGFTNVTATGGGFGPPAGCTNSSCEPATGVGPFSSSYTMGFLKNGGTTATLATNVSWSDTSVSGIVPSSVMGMGSFGVQVKTPFATGGVLTSPTAFQLCNGGGSMDHFALSITGNPQTNKDYTFSVVAIDNQGGRKTNYSGTITVTLSEGSLLFTGQPNYTFVAADNGAHRFQNGAVSSSSGSHTISVVDNQNPQHSGSITYNVR